MTNWRQILSYRDPQETNLGENHVYEVSWDGSMGGTSYVKALSIDDARRRVGRGLDYDFEEHTDRGDWTIYRISCDETGEEREY
jgi:hypothetical protein